MPLGKMVTGEPGPAKLGFYLEPAQMSLFFDQTSALRDGLLPMTLGENSGSNPLSESGPKLAIKSAQSNPIQTNRPFGPFKKNFKKVKKKLVTP
jgi:hypothetical protein